MKTRMLLLAVAVLAFASLSSAQFGLWLTENPDYNPSFPGLKCGCTGDPIPDGVAIEIWWDLNPQGYGPEDVLAPTNPSVTGSLNLNTLYMGAPDYGVNTGYFTPLELVSPNNSHPSPARYYLIVKYCNALPGHLGDSVVWKSAIFSVVADSYQEITPSLVGNWTCTTYSCGEEAPTCVPHLLTVFPNHEGQEPTPGPRFMDDCVVLCPGFNHEVRIGPHPVPHHAVLIPHVTVFAGCEPVVTPCDSICPPATGWIFPNTPLPTDPQAGWVEREIPVGSGMWYYVNTIVVPQNATPGCVCIFYDWKWPVEMTSSDFVALDNAVVANWVTASETNVNMFKIVRDGAVIGTVDATNEANGHAYSYTDETATNGTTYNYKLVVVGLDGAENVVATESVTPSFENAIVTEYKLHQNYPNPFNPTTRIAFDVLNSNPVTLTVYNATGQVVATLLNNANYSTGRYSVDFNAVNLTSGLYFYTVKIGNEFTATKKMLLVK